MMPSPYTADISWIDAREMARRLGVRYDEIPIAPMFDAFRHSLADRVRRPARGRDRGEHPGAHPRHAADGAVQQDAARIVLTTGNKSEMATGYCTLYGDMAGGFAVIKDVAKTLVYPAGANWKNAQAIARRRRSRPIPERIITRPPSAELRPDQTDQDSLPPYEVLDAILARYMEEDQRIDEIVAAGFERTDVERVARLIKAQRVQAAPGAGRHPHHPPRFGQDWRYPITSKFRA